jgi:hypothetical protein
VRAVIRKHHAGSTPTRFAVPNRGDADGEIRNGYPMGMYLPRDAGRRYRLLLALGYQVAGGNTGDELSVITTEKNGGNDAKQTSE